MKLLINILLLALCLQCQSREQIFENWDNIIVADVDVPQKNVYSFSILKQAPKLIKTINRKAITQASDLMFEQKTDKYQILILFNATGNFINAIECFIIREYKIRIEGEELDISSVIYDYWSLMSFRNRASIMIIYVRSLLRDVALNEGDFIPSIKGRFGSHMKIMKLLIL